MKFSKHQKNKALNGLARNLYTAKMFTRDIPVIRALVVIESETRSGKVYAYACIENDETKQILDEATDFECGYGYDLKGEAIRKALSKLIGEELKYCQDPQQQLREALKQIY